MRDTNDNTTSAQPTVGLDRRRFLAFASGAAATAAVAVAGAKPAAAQGQQQIADEPFVEVCDTMVVYRLRETWTEPRGPKGKTKLESNASRIAAKHRWALTEQDALDMNLHKCSFAPAEPVVVGRDAFMKIWNDGHSGFYTWQNPWNGKAVDIFDSRCLEHIERGDELWNEAFNAPCVAGRNANADRRSSVTLGSGGPTVSRTTSATTPTPAVSATGATPTPAATATTTTPTPAVTSTPAVSATGATPAATSTPAAASATPAPTATPTPTRPGGSDAALRQTPEQLAFTGNSTTPMVAGGTALVLLGAVSLRASRMEKIRLARIEADQGRTER